MTIRHIDFETRSKVDLTQCGVDVYAADPSTDILCMAYALDDDPVSVWVPWRDPEPPAFVKGEATIKEAWNVGFELAIWNTVGVRKYGFKPLSPQETSDPMARAYAMSLPGSLEMASAAVGLDAAKDMQGRRIMLQLSQPNSKGVFYEYADNPEKFEHLYRYCAQDVEAERATSKRLLPLSDNEQKIWQMDYTINRRGIEADIPAVKKAIELVEFEKQKQDEEMRRLTDNGVATCTANGQLADWCSWNGAPTQSVAKEAVIELLKNPSTPERVKDVLKLRQSAAKSSTAKLYSMLASAGSDGRIRGIYQYHVAGTGRWAGRRLQPQNFPRPLISQSDIDQVFTLLHSGKTAAELRDTIDLLYGEPLQILSSCLRGFLIGDLTGVDLNSIEARMLAWLAGEETVLEVFRTHGKAYEATAADIYRCHYTDIMKTDPRRQVGKVADLALGYQGGVGALQQMCGAFQVELAPAYPALWEIATEGQKDKALTNWKKTGKRYEISQEEFLASDLIKMMWREKRPAIVKYWTDLESAAITAVKNPGKAFKAGAAGREVTYKTNGSFLWCRLPSGRVLCYPYPSIEEVETPWGAMKDTLKYMGITSGINKWQRQTAYGGLLAENVTQASSRCVLSDAMLRFEERGYPIVIHVHDEIVVEGCDLKEAEKIMAEVPMWAEGLPIAAEGFQGRRYQK